MLFLSLNEEQNIFELILKTFSDHEERDNSTGCNCLPSGNTSLARKVTKQFPHGYRRTETVL
jgi:hypothetical protein